MLGIESVIRVYWVVMLHMGLLFFSLVVIAVCSSY